MSWRAVRSLYLASFSAALVATVFAALPSDAALGDRSSDRIWTEIAEPVALKTSSDQGFNQAVVYRTFGVNQEALQSALSAVPNEAPGLKSKAVVSIPMPDGSFTDFHVVEYALLSDKLAAARPGIHTYHGRGVEDPSTTIRMDVTLFGLRAQILSNDGLAVIDPYTRGNKDVYMSYWRHEQPAEGGWKCYTETEVLKQVDYVGKAIPTSGNTLTTYRLAVSATGEYTDWWGGVSEAEAGITTSINRINQVFERDTAVRMNLTAFNIYTDSTTDPFTTGTETDPTLLNENHADLNIQVGNGNYDIGHVFTRSGGTGSGIAQVPAVCQAGGKGRGASGAISPTGDRFDINIVAHEMGHQMGALHTFNGSTGACDGNRSGFAAYEPGSGSTIMSYAGICAGENVEIDALPMYHVFSLEQIINQRNGTGCGTVTNTGNTPPVADAGVNLTVPRETGFILTGSGTDADVGDQLTYSWEQLDLGAESPPTDPFGPLFETLIPKDTPVRTVPDLGLMLTTGSQWEDLPTVNRGVTWRLVVRDNAPGGGGVDDDEMELTISGAPFEVTDPDNFGITATSGKDYTVTWNVGGGSTASLVRIRLTDDAGQTFTVLEPFTDNDGSETVTLPCMDTTTARILVEAVDGVFFDASDFNFTIEQLDPVASNITAVPQGDAGDCVITTNFFSQVSDDDLIVNTTIDVQAQVLSGAATLDPVTFNLIPQGDNATFVNAALVTREITDSPVEIELKIVADDGCGITETTTTVILTDGVDPSITCPADIEVSTPNPAGVPAGDASLAPFFSGVSASDACDTAPGISNDAPATLPEGTTAVMFTATDSGGNTATCSANVTVNVSTDVPGALADGTSFRTIYPNPFNPRTTAMFSLGRAGAVQIDVHNMQGQLVRSLFSGSLGAGDHQVEWDGLDETGHSVASGVYVFTLKTADATQSRTAALIK